MSAPSLIGCKWRVVVNGKRTLNASRVSVTLSGDIESIGEGVDIFTLSAEIADQARDESGMGFPDSIQVTIFPKE